MECLMRLALALGLLVVIQVLLSPASARQRGKVKMCYFNNKAQNRPSRGRFTPGDIDPGLCTHILYAYAHLSVDAMSVQTVVPNDVVFYIQIIEMKAWYPSLKVLLSLGGPGTAQNTAFKKLVNGRAEKTIFIPNVITFLRHYGFDGLDVNWRYPVDSNRAQFQTFIAELRNAFDQEVRAPGVDKLLITIHASGDQDMIQHSFGPTQIQQYVDYFLLHTYDFWGSGYPKLGHHTALYVRSQDQFDPQLSKYSADKTVTAWTDAGVSREKIVLGLATFGKTTRLNDPTQHNLGDSHSRDLATPGSYTESQITLAYYEICENLNTPNKGWTELYVPETEGAIAYSSQTTYDWVCYDDEQSIRAKATYALDKGLAGVFFWSLDYDDFTGEFCGQGRYPLLTEVKAVFDYYNPPSPLLTTKPPTQPATEQQPPNSATRDCRPFRCPDAPSIDNPNHLFPDPYNCHKYYQCVLPGETSLFYSMPCPANLVFDPSSLRCDYPGLAHCVPCPRP